MTDPHIREAARIVEAAGNARPAVIRSFFDEDTFTVTHVISDPATGKAAIIDSVLDFDPASGRTSYASADKVIAYVENEGLEVEWLLETHAHADHLSGKSRRCSAECSTCPTWTTADGSSITCSKMANTLRSVRWMCG